MKAQDNEILRRSSVLRFLSDETTQTTNGRRQECERPELAAESGPAPARRHNRVSIKYWNFR
jgi:hypothetical protein